MTAEERRGLLHVVMDDDAFASGVSPFGGMFADMFRQPDPVVGPVPAVTRGFRIRLDLSGTKPPVWRRLELPGDLTLDRMHRVIQAAMGWTDSHLHRFRTGADMRSGYFLTRYDIEQEGEEGIDEADVRLDQVVATKGDRLWYEYDFGDGWQHVLAVEAVLDPPPERPTVVTGKRACPPEDCGGVWGYSELADWVRGGYDTSAVPQPFDTADQARDWLPLDWHPDRFDVTEAQELLDRALAPEVPLPDELMLIKLGLDVRGCFTLSELVARAVELDGAVGTAVGTDDPAVADAGAASRAVGAPEPTESQAAAAVAPFRTLLEVLGSGVRLTAAGYLPPAVVTELAARTGVGAWWHGKLNREDQTYPILELRAAARELGLISVRKGVLAPTAAARRCSGEPLALWRHIADRLPLGRKDFDRQAGWVSLAVFAAGTEFGGWTDAIRMILTDIGWRTTVDGLQAFLHIGNPTLGALEILAGRALGRAPDEDALAAAAMAARTAIFHRVDAD